MESFGSLKSAIFGREERKQQYQAHIRGLNAYDRHKKFLNDYGLMPSDMALSQLDNEQSPPPRKEGGYNYPHTTFLMPSDMGLSVIPISNLISVERLIEHWTQVVFYGKERSTQEKLPVKTDQDTLREGYRFIWSEDDDINPTWEQKLVKRYYDKLFKEYCIADMSHYKSGKIGLRWRTEKEVISGKGQFICGNKHCDEKDGLASYEVNFSYSEAGENKQALVKLVTCERCAEKLLYKKRKEKEQLRKREKEEIRKKRDRSKSDDDSDHRCGRSKEKRTGGKACVGGKASASASASRHKSDEEENFDEFLEGMFP